MNPYIERGYNRSIIIVWQWLRNIRERSFVQGHLNLTNTCLCIERNRERLNGGGSNMNMLHSPDSNHAYLPICTSIFGDTV